MGSSQDPRQDPLERTSEHSQKQISSSSRGGEEDEQSHTTARAIGEASASGSSATQLRNDGNVGRSENWGATVVGSSSYQDPTLDTATTSQNATATATDYASATRHPWPPRSDSLASAPAQQNAATNTISQASASADAPPLHPQMHPRPQHIANLSTHGQATINIPIDNLLETDSAYDDGDDLESATTSLRSAISAYIYENGRRYHAYRAGEYWGPNDEQMADQLDIGHHIHTMVLDGRLFLAPIGNNPVRALDVGTGTGIWAIDFADLFPGCQVIGTDLSPIQPSHVPPNLQFEVDDACSEWVYTPESFDFIHVRGMYGSVSDWPAFYAECMKHLKPGGYLEQVDTSVEPKSDDGTVHPNSVMARWGRVSLEAGDAFGKTLRCVDENKDNFIEAGFEDVVEYRFKLPIGGWSKDKRFKEIGMYTRLYWEEGIEGWCMFLLTRYLGWRYEEVMVYVAEMRRMLRDKTVHAYFEGSVVYGRKPLTTRR